MTKKSHKRFDLALNQLQTAIILYMKGGDKLSVITLAGAADVIFSELVLREKKENFADFVSKKENKSRARKEVGKEINDALCINVLKHLDPGDNDYVMIDLDDCAIGAILKALANYNMLNRKDDKLILGFWCWLKNHVDLVKYNINGNES